MQDQPDDEKVPLEEVSTLCRALGFFPTEKEVEVLLCSSFVNFMVFFLKSCCACYIGNIWGEFCASKSLSGFHILLIIFCLFLVP